MDNNYIILFDGACNFCNSSVNFIIKRDKKNIFKFGTLQSEGAKKLLSNLENLENELSTLIYIENGRVFRKSSAVLQILKRLGGIYKLMFMLIIIPKPLRTFFYDLIAQNRYRWFGKRSSCMVPTEETKKKFID